MEGKRRNEKMMLPGFVSHGQVQWIGTIFIFGIGVPSSIFVMITFLLAFLLKEQFLR